MAAVSNASKHRRSVNEEPSMHWTVEEVFHWCLLQSYEETDVEFQRRAIPLQEQLAKGKLQICESFREGNANGDGSEVAKNSLNQATKTTTTAKQQRGEKQSSHYEIRVDVLAGPHEGKSVTLQPSDTTHCLVGRSRGKAFINNKGLSLVKDCEVSTTHGKFAVIRNTLCFVDTGSTNGTCIANVALQADVPTPISNQTEITCGQSVLRVTLLS